MRNPIVKLGALLLLQLLLVVAVWSGDTGLSNPEPGAPLFDLKGVTPQRITLEGPEGEKLRLERRDGQWQLPELAGYPADQSRVKRLLERLGALKQGMPLALSEAAQQRFRVASDRFERRLTLEADGKTLARLYLGDSQGAGRAALRREEDSAIYSAKLPSYELPLDLQAWEEKSVLTFDRKKLVAITLSGLELSRSQAQGESGTGKWQASALKEGERLDPEAVEELVGKLAGLRIDSVLGREVKPEYQIDKPLLELTLRFTDGASRDYLLAKDKEGNHLLKSSSRAEYFRLASYLAEPLLKAARRDALVTGAQSQQSPSQTGEGASQ